jgi:predicted hydrolase (HD superfamily)
MSREEALKLVRKYTKNENLIKHMLAVESAMAAYYKKFHGEDSESSDSGVRSTERVRFAEESKWRLCGILHDFDYEKMGTDHPSEWGYKILRDNGVSEEIIQAIKGHGLRDNPDSRPTMMAKTLFAVDELTGFIVACALVHPEKLDGLEVDSIIKKFKKKDFAKAVSREDIYQGAEEIGVTIEEHVETVLSAMKSIKADLGL